MREIIDKVTCDICGKVKLTPYVYAGAEMIYPRILLRAVNPPLLADGDFYEIRATQHLCGHCINAVRAVVRQN